MEKKYLKEFYPEGISMEEYYFLKGQQCTQTSLGSWIAMIIIGFFVSLFGALFLIATYDAVILGAIVTSVGGLMMLIGSIGIAVYNYGLKCLFHAELLYNTRCAGKKNNAAIPKKVEVEQEQPQEKEDFPEPVNEPVVEITSEPEAFIDEILKTSTEDLELIYRDQKDLYTEEEFKIIEEVLKKRRR